MRPVTSVHHRPRTGVSIAQPDDDVRRPLTAATESRNQPKAKRSARDFRDGVSCEAPAIVIETDPEQTVSGTAGENPDTDKDNNTGDGSTPYFVTESHSGRATSTSPKAMASTSKELANEGPLLVAARPSTVDVPRQKKRRESDADSVKSEDVRLLTQNLGRGEFLRTISKSLHPPPNADQNRPSWLRQSGSGRPGTAGIPSFFHPGESSFTILDFQRFRVKSANYDERVKLFCETVGNITSNQSKLADYYTSRLTHCRQPINPLYLEPTEEDLARNMGNIHIKSLTVKALNSSVEVT